MAEKGDCHLQTHRRLDAEMAEMSAGSVRSSRAQPGGVAAASCLEAVEARGGDRGLRQGTGLGESGLVKSMVGRRARGGGHRHLQWMPRPLVCLQRGRLVPELVRAPYALVGLLGLTTSELWSYY